jgi:hypothetical protein
MNGLLECKVIGPCGLGIVAIGVLVLAAAGGCESSGPGAGASGPDIDPSKRVLALTPNEEAYLCNWLAGEWGGYGGALRCEGGGGTLAAPLSQPHCLMVLDLPRWTRTCPLTVGQFESCIDWQAQNVCLVGIVSGPMLPAECQLELGPACSNPMGVVDAGSD